MSDINVQLSPIEGVGIFALRAFRTGERITKVNIVREVTSETPVREDLGERVDHCAYPNGRVVLVAYPERHVNHSCDPNAYEVFEEHSSYLVARRAIAAGEEITVDYNINISNGTAWPCHCRAPRCIGEVVGDFFRLPRERQLEYRPLLAAWFVNRYRAEIEDLDAWIG
jgi:SET domain-containing protein